MAISVSGPSSTGKTTLVNEIKKQKLLLVLIT